MSKSREQNYKVKAINFHLKKKSCEEPQSCFDFQHGSVVCN